MVPRRHDYDAKTYWSVDIPGLTEDEASSLASYVNGKYHRHCIALDPQLWLTLHMDRETAETLKQALAAFELSGGDVGGLKEDVEGWIELQRSFQDDG